MEVPRACRNARATRHSAITFTRCGRIPRLNVDSYLEIFTTLFGWMFYSVLWDVLTETGVVYLPFLGILLDNWRESCFRSADRTCIRDITSTRRVRAIHPR